MEYLAGRINDATTIELVLAVGTLIDLEHRLRRSSTKHFLRLGWAETERRLESKLAKLDPVRDRVEDRLRLAGQSPEKVAIHFLEAVIEGREQLRRGQLRDVSVYDVGSLSNGLVAFRVVAKSLNGASRSEWSIQAADAEAAFASAYPPASGSRV